jgi:hypothetical protein
MWPAPASSMGKGRCVRGVGGVNPMALRIASAPCWKTRTDMKPIANSEVGE